MERNGRRTLLSWVFVCTLAFPCGVLAVLQYRWIGEVSRAERERLRGSLQASLDRLRHDFNGEITTACAALLPDGPPLDRQFTSADCAIRYADWKKTSSHARLIRRVAIVTRRGGNIVLRELDAGAAAAVPMDWPPEWSGLHDRLSARLADQGRRLPGPPGPAAEEALLIELPRFRRTPLDGFGRRDMEWLIFELDAGYLRSTILPEAIHRHLGSAGTLDYRVEVVTRARPEEVIYRSDPGNPAHIGRTADATVGLLELQFDRIMRRPRPEGMRDQAPGRGPGPDWGRWQLSVRHRAGSLEAVVERARRRNLTVTAGILLLMLATVAALVRYTRRAQRLAELQMDFVTGVSHELRTPLTVISTAAYNLRRSVAGNPQQVERYGALIQQQGERLTALVEQVLQFANVKAGRTIGEREPVSIESVIEAGVQASKCVLDQSGCTVEKRIEPGLPLVLGDPAALQRVLENLLGNAAKYGVEGAHWIGVSASRSGAGANGSVEIRVSDRGPGIPEDEQHQLFDPFFRGRRAIENQVHGTGLGLSLAKEIVEAHDGAIAVKSQPGKGTEFVVRIPAAPAGQEHGIAHTAGRG